MWSNCNGNNLETARVADSHLFDTVPDLQYSKKVGSETTDPVPEALVFIKIPDFY